MNRALKSERLRLTLIICLWLTAPGLLQAQAATQASPNASGYFVPAQPPRSHYRIDARFDFSVGLLEGREVIVLKNDSTRPMDTVALAWWMRSTDQSVELSTGGVRLEPRADVPAPPNTRSPLFFRLPAPLRPGQTLTLEAGFRTKLEESQDGFESSGWYPRLWWDELASSDDYSVGLTTPADYALAVSGRLDERTGRYEARSIKSFGICLAKGMKAQTVESAGVLITAISTEKGRKAAEVCLKTAADAVAFYRKWLGFYPYPFLNIIPGGPGRWGGYPFAAGIVVIHGLETYEDGEPPRHWQYITSHEIGHQYWGEWVLDGDDSEWLWICLGVYADTEFMLARGFDPDRRAKWMENYIQAVGRYYDTSLDVTPGQERRILYDRNNLVIHSKGPAFLNALSVALGPAEFERIYKKALRVYGGRRLGWREFQRFCEAETNQSLDWLFRAWVRGNDYLCYAVESKDCRPEGTGFRSEIKVRRLGTMAMPVPVKALFEDGTEQTGLTDRTRVVDSLVFMSRARLKDVVLDPEHRLALVAKPLSEIPEDAANGLAWGLDPARSLEVFDALRDTTFDSAPLWYGLGRNLFDQESYEEAAECFEKVSTDSDPDFQFLGPAWLGMIDDLRGNREKAVEHYRAALAHDNGQSFSERLFRFQIDRAWLEARLQTPFTRESAIFPDNPSAADLIAAVERLNWSGEAWKPKVIFDKTAGLEISKAGFWFKLGLLLFDSGFDEESLAAFLKAEAMPDIDKLTLFTCYVWQGHLNDLRGKREDALAAYRKALEADPGVSMTHSQFRMVINRAWVEARLKTPFQWKKRTASRLKAA